MRRGDYPLRGRSNTRAVGLRLATILATLLAVAPVASCGRSSPLSRAPRTAVAGQAVDSVADALQAADAAAARAELARARRAGRRSLAPDLAAACDTARALARRALHVPTRREIGIFDDLDRTPRPGCRLTGTGDFAYVDTTSTPPDTLLSLFLARGWRQDLRFQVDGDDGVTLGARNGTVLCILSGAWDESDDQPEDSDDYALVIECARDASRPQFDGSVSG